MRARRTRIAKGDLCWRSWSAARQNDWRQGLQRSEVAILNVIKCRPPTTVIPKPLKLLCLSWLEAQVDALQPPIIAPWETSRLKLYQATTSKALPANEAKLSPGVVFRSFTFHPAYLLRNPGAKKATWDDLQLVATNWP